MSNKEPKASLHMGALSAIKYYREFRNYYDRKVNEEKHLNSVINAVCNKIVLRVTAVVNNQELYEEIYKKAA